MFPHTVTTIRRPVPDSFTYAPDKELSSWSPIAEERRGRHGLGDNAEEYHAVFPEGDDATRVTCTVTYKAPRFWGCVEGRTFETVQTFRVYQSGRAEPAQSHQGRIT